MHNKENFKLNKIRTLDNRGMTLLEVMVSLLLIGIIASSFLTVFTYAFRNTVISQEITNRTYALQSCAEELRGFNYKELTRDNDTSRKPFDSNGDGTDDSFLQVTFEPFGVCDAEGASDAVYVDLIYYDEKIMVVTPEDKTAVDLIDGLDADDITLNVSQTNTNCVLTINDENFNFKRTKDGSKVIVKVNMEMKSYNYENEINIYENELFVVGDYANVEVKVYGSENIQNDFISNNVTAQPYIAINNFSTSLVKVSLDLYDEENDPSPMFSIDEVIEIDNGKPDVPTNT